MSTVKLEEIRRHKSLKEISEAEILKVTEETKKALSLKGEIPLSAEALKEGYDFIFQKRETERAKSRLEKFRLWVIGYLLRVNKKSLKTEPPLAIQEKPQVEIKEKVLEKSLSLENFEKITDCVRIINIGALNKALRNEEIPREAILEALKVTVTYALVPKTKKWETQEKAEK